MVAIKAVIFDMDGVIADTMPLHYKANRKVAREFGIDLTEEENDKYKGISRKDVVKSLAEDAGKDLSEEEIKEVSDRKNSYYQEYLKGVTEEYLLPGIKEFIKDLKGIGVKIAVASSSTNAKTVLEGTGVYDKFEYVVDARKIAKGKPDPEIFLKAAEGLGVSEEECVAIEDGEAGLKAILSTSMFSIGVGDSEYLKEADWNVGSTEELVVDELGKKLEGRLCM